MTSTVLFVIISSVNQKEVLLNIILHNKRDLYSLEVYKSLSGQ